MIAWKEDGMATTKPRWPDPNTVVEKATRGIIDERTASVEILDVPDEEILQAEGLTEAEARSLAEPTGPIMDGRAVGRSPRKQVHQV